jgi:hypothetical protein
MTEESISKTFTQRPLDDAQKDLIKTASALFSQIEGALNTIPASRLRSLALTEIEKTALVVNKAISRMNDTA